MEYHHGMFRRSMWLLYNKLLSIKEIDAWSEMVEIAGCSHADALHVVYVINYVVIQHIFNSVSLIDRYSSISSDSEGVDIFLRCNYLIVDHDYDIFRRRDSQVVLRCEENQLTKVDLSACPELENLYCYSMNTIKELILPTEQSFIKVLTLKDMPLVNDIKLTNPCNIEYFTLARAGVTTLDLSQANPKGTYYLGSNTELSTTKVWPDFDAASMGERWTVYNCPNMQITQ